MKIIQLTTDSRVHYGDYEHPIPYFGSAPEALFAGFATLSEDVELHVISTSRHPMVSPEKIAPNIWYHELQVSKWAMSRSLFLGAALATRKLIKEINPDIVHGQGTEKDCAMSAVLSGYPNVLTIHGNMRIHAKLGENRKRLYYKIASLLEVFCLHRTDGVVAISNYTKDLVKDITPRTWLLPNAVDSRFFDITLQTPAVPRLLFVGALDERKNPLGLLNACQDLLRSGECTIALAGQLDANSDYGKKFASLADSLPSVSLLGFLDRKQLAKEFANSSMLILPTFEDNCPMVVLEAMAGGLPVAASRVGGIPDLVTHKIDGLMFDPHSPTDLKATIESLVRDPALRNKLGSAARITAQERFHPKVIAAEHLRIYREVIASPA